VASGHECECFFESLLLVAIAHENEFLSSCVEHMEKIVIDTFQLFDRVSGSCFDNILWLWNTNQSELESCFVLDRLDLLLVL